MLATGGGTLFIPEFGTLCHSHRQYTPKEGAKVSKSQLTQFGRALHQLGIEMIAAYSPEARGRSERGCGTHQERLSQ